MTIFNSTSHPLHLFFYALYLTWVFFWIKIFTKSMIQSDAHLGLLKVVLSLPC
jgi:hypothetical protein